MRELGLYILGTTIMCAGLILWKANVSPTGLWLGLVPLGIMFIARSEAARWKP